MCPAWQMNGDHGNKLKKLYLDICIADKLEKEQFNALLYVIGQ